MLLSKAWLSLIGAYVLIAASSSPALSERIDRGTQVIDGTTMNTTIYHERGYAVFENACGSQRLSQSALQSGAKPNDIIPCPRPGSAASPPDDGEPSTDTADDEPPARQQQPQKRLWSAVAAGIENGGLFGGGRVSVGHAKNHATRSSAEMAAVRKCEEDVSSCTVVQSWNSGCYYITVSKNAQNVAWGAGPTAQRAYNACYQRVIGGNCDTNTLGSCHP